MRLFKFCPVCASRLELRTDGNDERPVCPSCGFVHYLNPAPASGAAVFRDGRLLLVKRAHEPYTGKWTIPAGFIEWGESPEETAVRELREETNLEIRIGDLFHVYAGSDDPRTRAILILYFACESIGDVVAGDDASDARWFAEHELPPDDEIAFESHRRAITKLKREYHNLFER